MSFVALQGLILIVIAVAIFIAAVFALVEALRYPPEAYVAAGKRTKTFWGAIVGGATVLAFLTLPPAFGFGLGFFFATAASAATIIFMVDVRPRLKENHRFGSGGARRTDRGGW